MISKPNSISTIVITQQCASVMTEYSIIIAW